MMDREDFDEFVESYTKKINRGYDYEEMAHFLMNNIDDLIDLSYKYFEISSSTKE